MWFDGEWHLFFQHHPDSDVWGPMHWGHAVSADLFHWEELPIALFPDPTLGTVFSGSAIADGHRLVALFTHHGGTSSTQKQSLAISEDRGRTWSLHDGNPVIDNPGIRDFRDPKLFRHGDGWIAVLAAGDHVAIYRSDDLLRWTWASDFGPEGLEGGVWECPDLFPLIDEAGEERWILKVDVNPGAPNGGSGGAWFLGHFDGGQFRGSHRGFFDAGADFYAAQSWSGTPDGRHLWIGWMNNWLYGQKTPTVGWRGAMTLPREVFLRGTGSKALLAQRPVSELESRRGETLFDLRDLAVDGRLDLPDGEVFDLQLDATPLQEKIEVVVRAGDRDETRIGYVDGRLFVDRTQSGESGFSDGFAARHEVACVLDGELLALRIVVDRCSVEVFAQHGTVVFTELIFPDPTSRGLRIESSGAVSIHRLRAFSC